MVAPGVDWTARSYWQKFIDAYEAKYSSRPIFPHFDGFNAYWGVHMMAQAAELGADAIINVRYMTTSVIGSAAELFAYGTAVKLGE